MSAFIAGASDSLPDRVAFQLWWFYGFHDMELSGARYHWIVDGGDIYRVVELADGTVINGKPWTESDLSLYQLTPGRRGLLLRALARSRTPDQTDAPKEATP